MGKETYKNVVIRKNKNGEVKEILELKTISADRFNELKQEERQNVSLNEKLEHEKQVALDQKEQERNRKDNFNSLCIAKLLFNDYVERGYFETSDSFEEMFVNWLMGGEYDTNKEPKQFKQLKERLGKKK